MGPFSTKNIGYAYACLTHSFSVSLTNQRILRTDSVSLIHVIAFACFYISLPGRNATQRIEQKNNCHHQLSSSYFRILVTGVVSPVLAAPTASNR